MEDPSPANTPPLGPFDRISVLLKEYETLRTEAIGRINNRFTFLTLGLGIATVAASKEAEDYTTALWALAGIFAAIWFYFGYLLFLLRLGIQRIEKDVNDIACAELLRWESKGSSRFFGWVYGWTHRIFKKKRKGLNDPPADGGP